MIRSTVNQSIISASNTNDITRSNGQSIETVLSGINEAGAVITEVKGTDTQLGYSTTHYSNGHNGQSE